MKRSVLEKTVIALLFVIILVMFNFAAKDSKRLNQLYRNAPADKEQSNASADSWHLPYANIHFYSH